LQVIHVIITLMSRPDVTQRKPGRPRAIPERLIPKVLSLYYEERLGYRAIARELREEGISVDWSTVRRIVKAHTEPRCRRE
jgi:transposase-like protein